METMQEIAFLRSMIETGLHEAGYADHPDDRGGPTMYGVTQATARANGYDGDMRSMGWAVALQIYYALYWIKPGWHRISEVDEPLAFALFDAGVNHGSHRAGCFLQEAINISNRNQKIVGNLKVDGLCGVKTHQALAAVQGQGELRAKSIAWWVGALRGAFYRDLIRADESQEAFALGWINRIMGG